MEIENVSILTVENRNTCDAPEDESSNAAETHENI